MTDPVAQACSIVDTLALLQLELLTRINKKFAALRNLARLLEQLADLEGLLPNINLLVPVLDINLNVYNQIRSACPFLKLPPAEADFNQLQVLVRNAYSELYKLIRRSPHFRLGKLQEEMDRFQNEIIGSILQASEFIRCLQTICRAGVELRTQYARVQTQIDTYRKNFATNAGKVLSAPAEAKYNLAKQSLAQLEALGADVKKDYSDAKKAVK